LYDSFLDEIVEDKNQVLWMGGYDRMIRWDKKKNQSRYYYCYLKNESGGTSNLRIRSLCFDKTGKLWVTCFGDGIAIFDEAPGTFNAS
jgi:ligand-binding sensor domain-containing protein